jgi:hypothetical protein
MNDSPSRDRWTWEAAIHPRVPQIFSSPGSTVSWQDELENAAEDAVTGKVLSVVAGTAIARAVIERLFPDHERRNEALDLLDLCDAWVDDPTDERFDKIACFLFEDNRALAEPNDPLKVAWGALRVATSSVGNYEAGWALGIVVDDANKADLDAAKIAWVAIKSRSVKL